MDALYLHKNLSPTGGKPQQAQSEAMHKEKLFPHRGKLLTDAAPSLGQDKALLTRGKFPAKPEKRTSEAAPYMERPSFLSNAPRLCFTSLHAQRKASNKCRHYPRVEQTRIEKPAPSLL